MITAQAQAQAHGSYASPKARFAVSGIGMHYSVWDNARSTHLMTGNPFHKRLDDAYAMAEFLNRHTTSQPLALPAPFTPTATDTGTDHGPHRFVVCDYRTGNTPLRDFPTLPDAARFTVQAVNDAIAADPYINQLPRYRVHECMIRPAGLLPGLWYARESVYAYAHPLYPASYTDSYLNYDYELRRTLDRIYGRGNDLAGRLVNAMCQPITPASVGNCLYLDYDKRQLSYLPANRPYDTCAAQDAQPGRVSGKPVRILKTLFPDVSGTDAEWEGVNAAIGAMFNLGTFVVLTGDAVLDAYCEENYSPAITWHSCMRYAYCRPYLAMYAQNPDVVSLLTLQDDAGLILARALIWQTDNGPYLDRIYANNDRVGTAMREYARAHLGVDGTSPGNVTLTAYDLPQYPYMDTFAYLNMEDGTLSPDEPYSGHYRELQSTSGRYTEYGGLRSYRVTLTRTVEQIVTVYVMAESEDDAYDIAREDANSTDDTYLDIETYETGRWQDDSVERDDD